MKLPIKRFVTSALALLLTVAMLMSTAGAIEFSGIPGGGGAQQNGDGTVRINLYSVRATTHFYEHLIGYRFSVVTGNGKLKSGTTVKDIFLREALLNIDDCLGMDDFFFYEAAARTATKLPKSEIRQTYTTEYADLSRNTVGPGSDDILDSLLGLSDSLPLSPDGIEVWCKADEGKRIEALLVGAGVIGDDGLSILDSTDRILVEPIFELTMHGQFCAATVTEIGVYEYDLYKDGYNDLYGCTYTSQNSGEYVYDGDYSDYVEMAGGGAILEAILRATNNKYPSLLYEDATGLPTVNGSPNTDAFWLSAPTDGKTGIPYIGTDKYGTE